MCSGTGTYFASAFAHFLENDFKRTLGTNLGTELGGAFVIFPDKGAYNRFHGMVEKQLGSIPKANVLYIEKKRVGTDVSQAEALQYYAADGSVGTRDSLPAGSVVLIPDDFTNSGSTLFGGAAIVRRLAAGGQVNVAAFVTHFVAKYDQAVVSSFVERLYRTPAELDAFYTTDSLPLTTQWLEAECAKRTAAGAPQRAVVMPLGPVIASWISGRQLPAWS